MTISAKIIADSISIYGHRMTTVLARYPRFIHAELLTHKDLSRSSASSRAIPTKRMIEDMRRDPALPVYWGSNKAGMQAGDQLEGDNLEVVKEVWLSAMERAISAAQLMQNAGLHKQIANRVLEPFSHITVLITATDWANTMMLRRHEAAQPEIHTLFDAIADAMDNSGPVLKEHGKWHLPFADDTRTHGDAYAYLKKGRAIRSEPTYSEFDELLRKVSTARCARTSYITFEGKSSTIEEDLALYSKLIESKPVHASPSEHQGTPDGQFDTDGYPGAWEWEHPELHGNLTGWIQFRKIIADEYKSSYP